MNRTYGLGLGHNRYQIHNQLNIYNYNYNHHQCVLVYSDRSAYSNQHFYFVPLIGSQLIPILSVPTSSIQQFPSLLTTYLSNAFQPQAIASTLSIARHVRQHYYYNMKHNHRYVNFVKLRIWKCKKKNSYYYWFWIAIVIATRCKTQILCMSWSEVQTSDLKPSSFPSGTKETLFSSRPYENVLTYAWISKFSWVLSICGQL